MHTIVATMKILFDPKKAATNYRKHGIRFSDAEAVLFDPMALTREDCTAEGEQRLVSVGEDATGRLLVVVFTYRGEEIRLISARKATAKERECYEN
jgi:uncharacterized DUF497 family protein